MLSGPPGVRLEPAVHADRMCWQAAHSQATLTEIELAVAAAVQPARTRRPPPPPDSAPLPTGPPPRPCLIVAG